MSKQQDNRMYTRIFKVKCVRYEKLTVFKQKFGWFFFFMEIFQKKLKHFPALGRIYGT